jgi:hypothetical protein
VFVICVTSSFEAFNPAFTDIQKSPFEKKPLYVTYWSKEQILIAIKELQGKDEIFVDLSQFKHEIAKKVMANTNGHSFFCAHYFKLLHDRIEGVHSMQSHVALENLYT